MDDRDFRAFIVPVATAGSHGIVTLCKTLRAKGILSDDEFLQISHVSLAAFDGVLDELAADDPMREIVERRRSDLEDAWGV